MSEEIVIVGVGVIGLSIAYQYLLKAQGQESGFKAGKITIIGKNFPADEPLDHEYTSPWAGAHFRPFPHRPATYDSDERESKYTRDTYRFFQELVKTAKGTTIEFVEGVDWLEDPTPEYLNLGPGYNGDSLLEFGKIPDAELPQDVKFGCKYLTYVLNAPLYLKWLQSEIEMLSVKSGIILNYERRDLDSLKAAVELHPQCTTLFNASGLGLQYNGNYDAACHKIRGQTVLLEVPNPEFIQYANKTVTHQGADGSWTFVIKRPIPSKDSNDHPKYILGGTKQDGDFLAQPRASDTEQLLANAKKLYSDLIFPDGQFHISKTNVGFRPAREGGSRVEVEVINDRRIVHAYGLGGMGYETSVGVALHALKLYQTTQ